MHRRLVIARDGDSNVTSAVELHFGNQEHTTAWHLARAFERCCPVTIVGRGHPSRSGRARSSHVRPPLVWVESGRFSLPRFDDLDDRLTVAWLIDTHRAGDWRRELARSFDIVYVAQRAAVAPLQALGVDARWLPLAVAADHLSPNTERTVDVDTVGAVTPGSRRERILLPMSERFGFQIGTYVPPDRMLERYAASRIVVNIPLAADLNMRAFEATGSGTHLVTGPMDGLEEVLPVGSFTVVDSDLPSDWIEVIEGLLADPDALSSSGRAAHDAVLEQHTYDHRVATMLAGINEYVATPPPAAASRAAGLLRAGAALGLPEIVWSTPAPGRQKAAPMATALARQVRRTGRALRTKLPARRG